MTGEETGGVIATHRCRGWTVAVEAFGPGVTGGTRLRRGRRQRGVAVAEVGDVSCGPGPGNLGTSAPSRLPSLESADLTQPGGVADTAAFLGMAGPALAGAAPRIGAVAIDEVGRTVTGWLYQFRLVHQRS